MSVLMWWGSISFGAVLFGAGSAVYGLDWFQALGVAIVALVGSLWPSYNYVSSQVENRSLGRQVELWKGRCDARDERIESQDRELEKRDQVISRKDGQIEYLERELRKSQSRHYRPPQPSDE